VPVQMRCCHLKHKGEMWTLDLTEDGAVVQDAGSNVRAEFTREEAAESFLFPSFSESIKQFRIPIEGELWYFDVAKEDLKQIKSFVDQAVVAVGPEAVGAVRNTAIRDTLIGIGGVIGGTVLTLGSFFKAAENADGGEYIVTYGLILVGLIAIGKGIYGFVRYGQLKQLSLSHSEANQA
jgi:hypothetical protein